jgi:hypothetical protein
VKYAPIYDPKYAYYNVEYQREGCRFEFTPEGGTQSCRFTVRPPEAFNLIVMKEVGYELNEGERNAYCNYYIPVKYSINITTPLQTYSFNFTSNDLYRFRRWRLPVNFPPGDVAFEFQASIERCNGQSSRNAARIVAFGGFAAYEYFWKPVTATATLAGLASNVMTTRTVTNPTITNCYYDPGVGGVCLIYTLTTTYTTSYLTTIPIDFQNQIKSAIVNGTETVSGDAVAHLAGTVQGGQIIKVKAPIVLLNYIYGIAGSPPAPPSGGGGGGEIGVSIICTLDQSVQTVNPSQSSSGTGSSGSGASPSTSSPQPANTISGSGSPDYYFLNQQVEVLRRGVCRPVTSVKPR